VTDGFTVTKDLLCSVPGSALEAMFSGRHSVKKVRGRIFISRDPELFKHLIKYLKNSMEYLPRFETSYDTNLFYRELDFWGIPFK
jgi:hypothetical protein